MITNLEHARHVENERLSFNSIYIAVVAGFFALAFDFSNPLLTTFFIGILLVISTIGFLFTKRWSDVFAEHSYKAQQLALLLYGAEQPNEDEEIINKYYYFNHDYRHNAIKKHLEKLRARELRQALKEGRKAKPISFDQAKSQMNFHNPLHRLCSIRTKTLFYLFYGVVISVLIIFFTYSIVQLATN